MFCQIGVYNPHFFLQNGRKNELIRTNGYNVQSRMACACNRQPGPWPWSRSITFLNLSQHYIHIVHTVVVISFICSQRRVDDKLNSNSVSDACLPIIDMCALTQNWHWCFLVGICVAYVDAQNVVMILWICIFWAICIGNLVYSVTCVNAQLQIFHWGRRNLFWNFSIDALKVENY